VKILLTAFTFVLPTLLLAETTTYQIHGVKSLTPFVDRVFNEKNNSFANFFCQENPSENASLILVIDGSALDGKTFFFQNVEACNQARTQVKDSHKNCQVLLNLNSENRSAEVLVGNCL